MLSACTFHNQASGFCAADGRVHDIVSVGDTVFLAGEFTRLTGSGGGVFNRAGIGACDRDGGSVKSWDVGLEPGAIVYDLALSADDQTLFLVGDYSHSSPTRNNAAAVWVDDAALRGWQPSPAVGRTNTVLRKWAGANQRIYLGGSDGVAMYRGTDQTNAGALAAGFSVSVQGSINAMGLSNDAQTLYLGGGNLTGLGGQPRSGAGAVHAATGAVLPFAPDLTDPGDNSVKIYDIIWHGGQVYYCGDWWQTEGIGLADKTGIAEADQDQRNVNRFDPVSGVADRTWWPRTNGGIQACAIDTEGDVMALGGHFQFVNGERRDDLATVSLEGGGPLSEPELERWNPATASMTGVFVIHIDTTGAAIVGGDDQLGIDDDGQPAIGTARFANNDIDVDALGF